MAELTTIWLTALMLLALGFLAIFVEFFILPGHTIFGLIGLFLLAGAIFYTAAELTIGAALILVVLTVIILTFIIRYFPQTKAAKSLVLRTQLTSEIRPEKIRVAVAIGDIGKAITPLRPAGTVLIKGERFDAMTEGDFISAGSAVEIISASQAQLLVKEKK